MAMMRRGPLAQYPAEWVLRQASETGATGSVEFHASQPMTLYLRGGRVCHGVDGVPATGFSAATEDGGHADEAAARAQTVHLVARALRATDGWYYLDPIGHHNDAGPWEWETAALIEDARAQLAPPHVPGPPATGATASTAFTAAQKPSAAAEPIAPVPEPAPAPAPASAGAMDRRVRLVAPETGDSVTLSAESWRIVCSLVPASSTTRLRESLGWTPDRLDAALTELSAAGVLGDRPRSGAVAATPAGPGPTPVATRASAPTPAPSAAIPPTVPPAPSSVRPAAVADRRSALRRLISNLKPA